MNSSARNGTLAGFTAYLLWGLFPLYFHALAGAGAVEILAHRIVWSVVVCAVAVPVVRGGAALRAVWARPRALLSLALGSVVLAVNWGVYVWAVGAGHVVEASLGYFVNPLLSILLGVVVLRERLRRLQWAAVAVAAVAVAVLTAAYGRVPWVALTLAVSFGVYGFVKKQVGPTVDALSGMTTEALVLGLPALGYLAWLHAGGHGVFGPDTPVLSGLLSLSGLITVGPLLLFASAARRIPLSLVGLLQYITPVMQFLIGVAVFGETVDRHRLVGFVLVWVSLVVLAVDGLRAARTAPPSHVPPGPAEAPSRGPGAPLGTRTPPTTGGARV